MNKPNNQSGSAHAVVIIVLIIAVLGLLGLVYWQNFVQKKVATPAQTQSSPSVSKTTPDPYSGWATYTNASSGFTFRYPSNWTLANMTSSGDPAMVAMVTSPDIAAETKGSIDAAQYDIAISTQKKTGSTTGSSLAGVVALKADQNGQDTSSYFTKKYTATINSLAVTQFDMIAQTPYFTSLFASGDKYVEVDFVHTATKADLSATASKILSSFKTN